MIGKPVVGSRQVDFGHVAGDAVPVCNFAYLCPSFAAAMTRLAFRIVHRRLSVRLRMRVVTGQTAYAGIIRIEALAFCEPIGLESHVRGTRVCLHGNLLPCPVAAAAKIGGLLSR